MDNDTLSLCHSLLAAAEKGEALPHGLNSWRETSFGPNLCELRDVDSLLVRLARVVVELERERDALADYKAKREHADWMNFR